MGFYLGDMKTIGAKSRDQIALGGGYSTGPSLIAGENDLFIKRFNGSKTGSGAGKHFHFLTSLFPHSDWKPKKPKKSTPSDPSVLFGLQTGYFPSIYLSASFLPSFPASSPLPPPLPSLSSYFFSLICLPHLVSPGFHRRLFRLSAPVCV